MNRRGAVPNASEYEYNIKSILKELILVCQKYQDPRAERFFKQLYALESRPDKNQERSEFIQFCIRRKRLTEAEYICHLELNKNKTTDSSVSSEPLEDSTIQAAIERAHSMSLLAQVKHLQGNRRSSMYYINRAIATLEPYGHSNEQVILKGLKAQLLRHKGDLREAEELLNTLLQRDLAEENLFIGHDPAPVFNTVGGDAFGSTGLYEYENSNHEKRADPSVFIARQDYETEKEPSKVEMADLKWTNSAYTYNTPRFLRACTLVALSDLNAELKRTDRVIRLRQQAIELVEEDIRSLRVFYANCFGYKELIQHLPKSQRKRELLEKIQQKEITGI